jgi:hypothetical protein
MALLHILGFNCNIKWKGFKGEIFLHIYAHNEIQMCYQYAFCLQFTKLKVKKHLSFFLVINTIPINNSISLNHF